MERRIPQVRRWAFRLAAARLVSCQSAAACQRHSALQLLWPREFHDRRFRHALHVGGSDARLALPTPAPRRAISARWLPTAALNLAATGTQSAITFADAVNSLKLAGVASLAMTGTGSLVLDSGGLICTGTPSASSTISGGTLSAPGGELVINTATNLIVSSLLSASAALTKTGTGTLTLTAANSLLGSTFINQGTLAYAPTANFSYGGAISGAGNLLMAGTGAMLTLSGTSTYSGSTTVTAGTLCVNGSLAGGGVNLPGGGVVSGSGSILGNVTVTGGSIAQNASLNIAGNVTVNSGACRLARPVNESCQRRGLSRILSRPLPACLAGEQVFWRGGIIAIKTPSPARRAGRGRRRFGKTRSFAKKTPSPARQAGRGQTPSRSCEKRRRP